MVGSGYKKIMWGILISGLHINIGIGIGVIQVIPATVGFYIIYIGLKELCEKAGLEYMEKPKRDAMRMVLLSAAFWAFGFLFDYTGTVAKGLAVCLYLVEILLYGDILNKTVKYYKENNRMMEADSMRKRRMSFIKAFLVLIVLHLINMIPFSGKLVLLTEFLTYACSTLLFLAKVWLSLIIQRLGNELS